VTLIDQFQRID
jgi:hypothetical protein